MFKKNKKYSKFSCWDVWMEMKENIKFQDDRDRQQTDVGSKKYPDNESVISCPGEAAGLLGCWAAGPFTFLISLTFSLI